MHWKYFNYDNIKLALKKISACCFEWTFFLIKVITKAFISGLIFVSIVYFMIWLAHLIPNKFLLRFCTITLGLVLGTILICVEDSLKRISYTYSLNQKSMRYRVIKFLLT